MRHCALVLIAWCLSAQPLTAEMSWYRGNTHAHTNRASPDVVVRWYKEHGYDFVALTDLNYATPVKGLNAVFGAPGRFLVLPGFEVSETINGRYVDVNALGVREVLPVQDGATIGEKLNRTARAIRSAGGLPYVCHPNLTWALTAEQIAAATDVLHFELWNAEPDMHNRGGGGAPSTEEIWDHVLSTGRVLYGIAGDDAHDFHGEFSAWRANPGRAWIVVRAQELTASAILAAIERGDFYSSTGVELESYEADKRGIRIELPEETGRNATRYRTYFIGREGTVLKQDDSLRPSYRLRGDELYVRARVEDSNGMLAWTQPVFPKKK